MQKVMKYIRKINKPEILLVTTSASQHASILETELNKKGVPSSRVDTDALTPINWPQLHFNKQGKKTILFQDNHNRTKNLDEFSAIWFDDIYPSSKSFENIPYSKWAFAETKKALEWIFGSAEVPYISKLSCIIAASNKIVQLQRAVELGLSIPETIISSEYNYIKNFIRYEKTVYKPISRPTTETTGENRIVLTTMINDEDVTIDSVSCKLSLFQKYIEKKYEIRTYVIGEQVLSAEIHSQMSSRTKIDWRNYDIANTPHYLHELPKDISNACKDLTHSFGLRYSAIDMIVTPRDEYIFLELNPQGLWLWIEKLTNLGVSSALANELATLAVQ